MIVIYSSLPVEIESSTGQAVYENPSYFAAANRRATLVYTDAPKIRELYEALGVEVKPLPKPKPVKVDGTKEKKERAVLERTARDLGIAGRLPDSDDALLAKIKAASAKQKAEAAEPPFVPAAEVPAGPSLKDSKNV